MRPISRLRSSGSAGVTGFVSSLTLSVRGTRTSLPLISIFESLRETSCAQSGAAARTASTTASARMELSEAAIGFVEEFDHVDHALTLAPLAHACLQLQHASGIRGCDHVGAGDRNIRHLLLE